LPKAGRRQSRRGQTGSRERACKQGTRRDRPDKPPGESRIIESNAEARPMSNDAPVGIDRADALITLIFRSRATALDEAAQQEMKRFMEQNVAPGGLAGSN